LTLVAISASYGAGGSHVAPAVAERLDVPFVDRAIPFAVADRLEVPVADAEAAGEEHTPGLLERLIATFSGQDVAWSPVATAPDCASPEDFHAAADDVIRAQAETGVGVLLGRASVAALRDDPRVLRVRLDGPVDARIDQALRLGARDRRTAERSLHRTDNAHAAYVKRFYGIDVRDPRIYQLVIDSTALDLDACVELIVAAARSLAGAAAR
jgi:cytidylate kinase